MPLPQCLGPQTMMYIFKIAGILGAAASGFYTTWRLMWNPGGLRFAIVYCYLVLFSMMLLSAELSLFQHRHFKRFGRFLTTLSGRSFMYIFMGGLMLNDLPGYIVGIYLMCLGFLSLFASCVCSSAIHPDQRVDQNSPAQI